MTFGEQILDFYKHLDFNEKLPPGVSVMNPYQNPQTQALIQTFLQKYFADSNKRIFVFGINPGRFGAGITGITFTDPVALREVYMIPNDLGTRREISAEYVHEFITLWGGPEKFYQDFFLTAASPLGFLKGPNNYNFYDSPELLKSTTPFIVQTIKDQIKIGGHTHAAIVFGTGKNQKVFEDLNSRHKFFEKIYYLEHPRFIMQYRRKRKQEYLDKYLKVFKKSLT